MRKYTKEEAIAIAVRCAEQYREELEGKSLLFLCTDKHKKIIPLEVSFYGNNYMHLTGLKTNKLFANDFYQKCLDHKLSPSDISFSEDGTTQLKLEVLPAVIAKHLKATMIGDYHSGRPRLYTEKIAGSIHACMGFVLDPKIQEYVPNTVVKEDVRDMVKAALRVVAVYRKESSALRYEERTYLAKKTDLSSLEFPEELLYLKSEDIK